jgi:hypothetical protein
VFVFLKTILFNAFNLTPPGLLSEYSGYSLRHLDNHIQIITVKKITTMKTPNSALGQQEYAKVIIGDTFIPRGKSTS